MYRVRLAQKEEHPAFVQRLFTMFPRGLPGLALLLLRFSVALALLLEYYGHRSGQFGWIQGLAILLALTLCAGYMTPLVAAIGLIFHLALWFSQGVDSVAIALIVALDAMALAFLGPGAYSVDAHRFGRRVIVLPHA